MSQHSIPPDWDAIRIFLSVSRSATFANCAKRLGVTSSAVSQRISQLERQLGRALFYRSNVGIKLTEFGASFLARCETMETAYEDAIDVTRTKEQVSGTLHITSPDGLIDALLIPALHHFQMRHPALRYRISASDVKLDLGRAAVDLALRFGWVDDGAFIAKKLALFEEVICAAPSYLSQHGTPIEPADLQKHSWVGYEGFGASQELHFRERTSAADKASRGGKRHKVTLSPSVLVSNAASIKSWLRAGAGLSRQPKPAVEELLKCGELVEVLKNYMLPGPTLYAVYLPAATTKLAASSAAISTRELVKFLADAFKKRDP